MMQKHYILRVKHLNRDSIHFKKPIQGENNQKFLMIILFNDLFYVFTKNSVYLKNYYYERDRDRKKKNSQQK